MQAKQRYILLFLSCAFLALCYFGGYRLKGLFPDRGRHWPSLDCYMDSEELMEHRAFWSLPPKQRQEEAKANTVREQCRMETCFDFSKCVSGFKVYIHPVEETVAMSSTYRKILNVITESRYIFQLSLICFIIFTEIFYWCLTRAGIIPQMLVRLACSFWVWTHWTETASHQTMSEGCSQSSTVCLTGMGGKIILYSISTRAPGPTTLKTLEWTLAEPFWPRRAFQCRIIGLLSTYPFR